MKTFKINQVVTDRQDASLKMFFKDVSKIPLITPEEEIELSKRIKNGDKAAINKLVESNLRFVISVAKQYQNKGLPLVDLIQAGCEGCIVAAKRWDEARGFKFISYAVWWIRQSIMRAIAFECRTVRVPTSQILHLYKINKASEKLEQQLDRTPSVEEISDEIDLKSNKINITLSAVNKSLSLNNPFKIDEDAGCLLDVIPDTNLDNTDDSIIQNDISEEIEHILTKLSNRESDIIRMFFGIRMTALDNATIAHKFGITSERVRQIQKEVLLKIRKRYGNILRDLL